MTVGVLLMGYGTPEHEVDLLAYYTDIRRGRPPTDEQLADLRRRYDAIGGLSPLAAITRDQRDALARELGDGFAVEVGLKHAEPKVERGVAALESRGVESIVGLVLAPHTSVLSTGQYHERAEAAATVAYRGIGRWGHHVGLIDLLAARVRGAMELFPYGERVELLVTAHSLPVRALDLDEPSYPAQLQETADLVAKAAALTSSYQIAWQSAGRTPDPWLGPDILDVVRSLTDNVLVCPAGFTADHLEVLYDIDIEARRVAEEHGLHLERTASLNDDPAFVSLLASLVREAS